MATEISAEAFQKIHFIGIGGVSMCSLALMAHAAGSVVTGTDLRESRRTARLREAGIEVKIGHYPKLVEAADAVVYTDAIQPDDPELVCALRLGKTVLKRGVFLGLQSEKYPHTVAIAGTHGKTSTTGMAVSVFMEAGLDPSVHIGADIPDAPEGVRAGNGGYFISEACEYKRNFLSLTRETAVVLNVEADHLDYFKDMDDIVDAYSVFLKGAARQVVNNDDVVLRHLAGKLKDPVTFGMKVPADYHAKDVRPGGNGAYAFDLWERGVLLGRIELGVIGYHNVYNALAAAACARLAGAPFEAVAAGLAKFSGAERRMQLMGEYRGAKVIVDYAHHPSEIKATLCSALSVPHRRIIAVFEPHTYSRLKALFFEFARCFSGADEVVLADVFAAREKPIPGITGKALAAAVKETGGHAVYCGTYDNIVRHLSRLLEQDDLLLILGAGDVNCVWDKMNGVEK